MTCFFCMLFVLLTIHAWFCPFLRSVLLFLPFLPFLLFLLSQKQYLDTMMTTCLSGPPENPCSCTKQQAAPQLMDPAYDNARANLTGQPRFLAFVLDSVLCYPSDVLLLSMVTDMIVPSHMMYWALSMVAILIQVQQASLFVREVILQLDHT